MAKKRNYYQQNAHSISFKPTITRKSTITYRIIAALISGVGIAGYKSMIPTNGNTPVFGIPINHFVKAKYSARSEYEWVSMSSGFSKGLKSAGRGGGAADAGY